MLNGCGGILDAIKMQAPASVSPLCPDFIKGNNNHQRGLGDGRITVDLLRFPDGHEVTPENFEYRVELWQESTEVQLAHLRRVRELFPDAAITGRDEGLLTGNVVFSKDLGEAVTLQGGLGLVSRAAGVTERYFAFALAPSPSWDFASNPINVEIIP